MNARADIAVAAAAGLRRFAKAAPDTPVMIGFDGFVDSIIRLVDQRHSVSEFDAIPTIAQWGQRIAAAAGQSANFEMVTTLQKLGGNGPIMANAMATAGLPVTYIGALGVPEVHAVFEPFTKIAHVHSIAAPGLTDALEFDDGSQIIINRQEPMQEIWLASKSGGFHFALKDGEWTCSKTGLVLMDLVQQECSKHAGEPVSW